MQWLMVDDWYTLVFGIGLALGLEYPIYSISFVFFSLFLFIFFHFFLRLQLFGLISISLEPKMCI